MHTVRKIPHKNRRKQELEILYQLAHDLARSSDTRAIAEHLFARTQSLLSADYGFLMLTSAAGRELRGVAAYGVDSEVFRQERIDLREELAPVVLAFQKKQPVVVTDVAHNPLVSERLRKDYHFVKSAWLVPLMSGESTVGAFMVGYASQREATPEELRLLQLFGDEAALALERARLTEELRDREQRLGAIFAASPDYIYLTDSEGNLLDANPALLKRVGVSLEQMQQKNFMDFFAGDNLAEVVQAVANVRDGQEIRGLEIRARDSQGGIFEYEVNAVPLKEHGAVTTVLNLARDITARKRAQEALRESQERYRAIVENTYDLICELAQDAQYVYLSPNYPEVLGYMPSELLGRNALDLVHPTDLPAVVAAFNSSSDQGQGTFRARHKTGEWRWIESTGKVYHTARGERRAVIVSRDITARKRAEEAVAQLAAIVESSEDAIISKTLDGIIVSWNAGAQRIYGYAAEEVKGHPISMLAPPARFDEVLQIRERTKRGEHVDHYETVRVRKDGKPIHVSLSISSIKDAAGKIIGISEIVRDLTERKHLESQLALARKLEAIGQLAAGIAHEINTPMQYVGDNTRFLQDAFHDLEELLKSNTQLLAASKTGTVTPELVTQVEAAAAAADLAYLSVETPKAIRQSLEGIERVTKIVQAMKEFSHPGTEEKVETDLNRAIDTTITVARNEWKYVAELVTDFDPALPPVPCLPGDFNQVILNLIVNASHAIAAVAGDGSPDKGTITVSTRHEGDWVEIRVCDTGTGIPEAIRSKIFDPFFTTKEVGKGTGQGLAIAHSVIVDKFGGTLTYETTAGKGTTFIIRLPLAPEPLPMEHSGEKVHSLR